MSVQYWRAGCWVVAWMECAHRGLARGSQKGRRSKGLPTCLCVRLRHDSAHASIFIASAKEKCDPMRVVSDDAVSCLNTWPCGADSRQLPPGELSFLGAVWCSLGLGRFSRCVPWAFAIAQRPFCRYIIQRSMYGTAASIVALVSLGAAAWTC